MAKTKVIRVPILPSDDKADDELGALMDSNLRSRKLILDPEADDSKEFREIARRAVEARKKSKGRLSNQQLEELARSLASWED